MRMFFNRAFFSRLISIALPITIQQAMIAAVNLLDVMMIGQLGEVQIAAVGLANQFYFIYMITVFGIGSGAGIFIAQYWGKEDVPNLRKVMGLALLTRLTFAALFTSAALIKPDFILGLYTRDPAVIAAGAPFLKLSATYYPFTAVTFLFAVVLRSTGNVKIPVIISSVGLMLKVTLNYLFIFGNFGFPAMGIQGAALSTIIMRALEFVVIILISYKLRTAAAAKFSEWLAFDKSFIAKYVRITLPVLLNESTWSIGISVYQSIYARIGTQSIAAMNISSSIEGLTFVFFMALANSLAIILGNEIGAGEERLAQENGQRALILSFGMAVALGLGLIMLSPYLLPMYNISGEALGYARKILLIMGLALWIRGSNAVILVGILRAGGDTRFAFFAEFISMWVFGIPMAATGAFVLHLEVYWVFVMVLLDELIKLMIGVWRFRSGKWVHNLVTQPEIGVEPDVQPV